MSTDQLRNVGVVLLAAGRGSRLGCTDIPKVMLEIGGKPVVSYTVETLERLGIPSEHIVMVVGFKQEKVREYFKDCVRYAEQTEQRGTADAAYRGIRALPEHISHVMVLGGDDSAFYTRETLEYFFDEHLRAGVVLSLLSCDVPDPRLLGRVVRHSADNIEVIEKEYVTPEQAKIMEISTGTYCFDRQWFESIFPDMPPLRKLGEYGLPTAMAMARERGEKYQVVKLRRPDEWFGINTPEELAEAGRRKQLGE